MESDSDNHRHDPTVDVGEKGEEGDGHADADGEAGGDPADDVMLDIDGEDLIFSDDTFPSLPDFPCLTSPSASPSPSSARNTCLSSSSSSSSSSASWPFLKAAAGGRGGDMQSHGAVVPSAEGAMVILTPSEHERAMVDSEVMDILGDIDLLDLTEDTYDPSYLFPDDSTVIEDGGTPLPGQQEDPTAEEGLRGGGEVEGAEEDMANVFLEWLKSNKDTISPEDLRSIKLNRSTVDCAAHRLGGGKQGRVQLLKLILAWVQNHHLQKKRRRLRQLQQQQQQDRHGHNGSSSSSFSYQYQNHQPFPPPHHQVPVLPDATVNPNPNLDHYTHDPAACNSWIPYPADATTAAAVAFPSMMMPYGGGGAGGDRGGTAPYHYPTSSIVVNTQPFSPSPDFHAIEAAASWPPANFPAAPPPYSPFPGPSAPHPAPQYPGSFASQYTGQQMYHQGQGLVGLASATKEARKKRMARQRRSSSLHHPRHQNHHPHPNSHPEASSRPPTADVSSRTNTRNWAFWSSLSSSPHQIITNSSTSDPLPPPPNLPTMPQPQPQPQQRNAGSSDKRQGWKSEKNLRFLLQKVLKQSDVGSLGRIVLPKKEAEIHLPELDARDGISIPMEDIGTSRVWNMRYRFWPNNKSRMYLLENTGDFVRSNGLKEGDFIVIYSDVKCGKYMIRGVKVRHPPPEAKGAGSKNSGKAHSKRPGGGGPEKTTAGASKSTAANRNNCDGNMHKSPPPTEDDVVGGHASPTNIKIEGSP